MTQDSDGTRGQSEVIGVVLLVGVVVILAAIVGVFAINLAGNSTEKAPQVNFEAEQYGDNTTQVWLYHDGGDIIENPDTITVTVNGSTVLEDEGISFENPDGKIDSQTAVYFARNASDGSSINASEKARFPGQTVKGLNPGTEIRIVWEPEDADNSAILFEYEVESRG